MSGASGAITAQPRASPAQYGDLVLLDPGSATVPFALMVQRGGDVPVLVDPVGAGLDRVGGIYRLAAQPVAVGSRDGTSQFLDPLQPAELTGTDAPALGSGPNPLAQKWGQDERYLATTRAIAGQPTVLDAAYNAFGDQLTPLLDDLSEYRKRLRKCPHSSSLLCFRGTSYRLSPALKRVSEEPLFAGLKACASTKRLHTECRLGATQSVQLSLTNKNAQP